MKINDVINKYYNEFQQMINENDKVICQSKQKEDLFHESLVRAMKKFGDEELDEDFAYN